MSSEALWQRLHHALAEAETLAAQLDDASPPPSTALRADVRDRLQRLVARLERGQTDRRPPPSPLDAVTADTLSQIVDHLPAMLFLKEPRELRMVLWNRAGEEIVGLPRQIMVGKTDFDLFPPEQARSFVDHDRRVLAGQPSDVEEPIDTPNGRRWLHTRKVALVDGDGRPQFLLGISQDITERRRAERELRRAKEAAETAALTRSAFLSNVSHELRTPLTLILGPVQLLLDRPDLAGDARAMLLRVQRNAVRLLEQVNDLLDLTRLEAGRLAPAWRRVDLDAIVSRIVDDARDLAAQRDLTLEFEQRIAPDAPERVPTDRRMLEKIVLNLLGNALKFTPPGGQIRVTLARDAARTVLAVRDTGVGISPDQLPNLFERFGQLDDPTTRRFAGSGLGLAIVKDFATLLGGDVEVESAPARGSTFTVTLPVDPAHQDAAPDQLDAITCSSLELRMGEAQPLHSEPAPVDGDELRPTLVLAEDNVELLRFVEHLLADEYRVHTADHGARALELSRTLRPDVVLSDIMMPELDGLALVAALRADPALAATPVVLLTARAGEESLVGSLETGADDYLAKPFSAAELRARLRSARRIRDAQRELALVNDELHRARHEQRRDDLLALAVPLLQALAGGCADPRVEATLARLDALERACGRAFGQTALASFLPRFVQQHGEGRWRVVADGARGPEPLALIAPEVLESALCTLLERLFGSRAVHLGCEAGRTGAQLMLRAEGLDAEALRARLAGRPREARSLAELLTRLELLAAQQTLCAAGGELEVEPPDTVVVRL